MTLPVLPPGFLKLTIPPGMLFTELDLKRDPGTGEVVFSNAAVLRILTFSGLDLDVVEPDMQGFLMRGAMVALHQIAITAGEAIDAEQVELIKQLVGREFAHVFPCYADAATLGSLTQTTTATLRLPAGPAANDDLTIRVPADVRFADLHLRRNEADGTALFAYAPLASVCAASGLDMNIVQLPVLKRLVVEIYWFAIMRGETIDPHAERLLQQLVATSRTDTVTIHSSVAPVVPVATNRSLH